MLAIRRVAVTAANGGAALASNGERKRTAARITRVDEAGSARSSGVTGAVDSSYHYADQHCFGALWWRNLFRARERVGGPTLYLTPKGMHATHSHVSGLERHAPSQETRRGVGPRVPGEAASSLAQALRSECRQRGSRHTYTRFMMGAFHGGRRCGTCCDGNDTVSPMCAGADWDGAFQLRKTSLLEVEARCSRDEACEGYYAWNKPPNYTDVGDMVRPVTRWGTTGGAFRFKSGKVYGWAKLERIACSWPDLRRRAADADARAAVPGPEHLLAPMREWADEAWARLQQSGDLGRMQLRADQLRNFTSSRLPSAARELPVLYLFGGADLLTASWLFPSATRHTLMSALPLGQPSCFLQSACRAQAHKAAADYFQDWAHNSYAWTQSEYMVNYWFTPKVGVLPALLLSLRILGERLIAMERSSSYDEITLVGDSVETNAAHTTAS